MSWRRHWAVAPMSVALLTTAFATPALSQGPMTPGGGAMTPPPRVAPPPPPVMTPPPRVAPPPPPVMAPMPSPMGAAPQASPSQQKKDTTQAAPDNSRLFADSRNLVPVPNVGIVSTNRTQGGVARIRSDARGIFSLGTLRPGEHEVVLSGKDLPAVRVQIVAAGAPRQVEHTYARVAPAQGVRVRITIPNDNSGAVVDWGDGTPSVNVTREGTPIEVNDGRRTETLGRITFVDPPPRPRPPRLGFIMGGGRPPWQEDPPPPPDGDPIDDIPELPWWQQDPPPPPDGDPIDDIPELPWWQQDPPPPPDGDPIDDIPIPEIDIIITDDGGGGTETITDEQGIFTFGRRPQGEIRLVVPRADPPRPPVKIALVLPTVQGDHRLLEHIYAPDTTGQTLRIKLTAIKRADGAAQDTVVDWGDGTPTATLSRDGKPVKLDRRIKSDAVGRVLFLGPTRKSKD